MVMPLIDRSCIKILMAAFSLILFPGISAASPESPFIRHVAFLSSAPLQGRLSGSAGEQMATDYIARVFSQAGLEPAGDNGTWFQSYEFTLGTRLGSHNVLVIHDRPGKERLLRPGKDWLPLVFSDNRSFATDTLYFAGNGVALSHHQLDIKGKWIVILEQPGLFTRRYLAHAAKEQGAKGIVFLVRCLRHSHPARQVRASSFAGMVAIIMRKALIQEALQRKASSSLRELKLAIQGRVDLVPHRRKGRNVLARLRVGRDNRDIVIVGAHGDHLGMGALSGTRARAGEAGQMHPGADDNASGVASVLETARTLSHLESLGKLAGTKDFLFAVWSGEELGNLGSTWFVRQPHAFHIRAALNLDMVGHLDKALIVQGAGSSPVFRRLIAGLKGFASLPLRVEDDPWLPTDSLSFYLKGVPSLNFFTGAHENWHTPRDTPGSLNYSGLTRIKGFMVQLLSAMESDRSPWSYHKMSMSHPDTRAGQGRTVWLGTIPDYGWSERPGVRLSGVVSRSPAEKAGLREGDIIVQVRGGVVKDIQDYSVALESLPVSRPVALLVLRKQKIKCLTVIPRRLE